MELKQLEFFLMCVDCGSLGKAAERLYTSQPNVSKVIRSLEEELGNNVFERTSRGLRLTPYGKSIYDYALNTVKNANLILNSRSTRKKNTLYISTYQSNSISNLLVNLYKSHEDLNIEHRQGTVEEIITQVEHGISEIGILYISQKRINTFLSIVSRKGLEFVVLGKLKACIYAGPNSPFYNAETVRFETLPKLKYISGLNDFFSVDDGIGHISLGPVNPDELQSVVCTNSEHLSINFLLKTDLVSIGMKFDYPKKGQYKIKNVSIEGDDSYLTFGYVIEEGQKPSEYANELVTYIQKAIKP